MAIHRFGFIPMLSLIPLTVLAADGTKPVTFTKDIAPIFERSCQTCHHAGTSAPMSLVTYNEIGRAHV